MIADEGVLFPSELEAQMMPNSLAMKLFQVESSQSCAAEFKKRAKGALRWSRHVCAPS